MRREHENFCCFFPFFFIIILRTNTTEMNEMENILRVAINSMKIWETGKKKREKKIYGICQRSERKQN